MYMYMYVYVYMWNENVLRRPFLSIPLRTGWWHLQGHPIMQDACN